MGIKKLETSKRLTLMKRTEVVINCLHPKKKKGKSYRIRQKTKNMHKQNEHLCFEKVWRGGSSLKNSPHQH